MSSIPKFNFKSTVSELEMQAIENKPRGSTQFEPGQYDLKIIDAQIHIKEGQRNPGRSDTDPNWIVVKLTLGGINDKSIQHYLLVPTITDVYRKPGSNNPLAVMGMFRKFLRSIGIDPENNMSKILNDNFADVSALIGKTATVKIDFEGNHAKYNPVDRTYTVVDMAETKQLLPNSFPDRDSAKAAAAELGLELKNFTKIKEFIPKENESKVEAQSTTDGW